MDRNQVSERLTGVLVSELGLDAAKIADEAHFEEDLDVTTASVPGATITTRDLALWREEALLNSWLVSGYVPSGRTYALGLLFTCEARWCIYICICMS